MIHRVEKNHLEEKPFGRKTIVLGSDFIQILPIVTKGQR
jgi:hypothetical protein